MLETRVDRVRRTATVQEDWLAWLPEAKEGLFAFTHHELQVSYAILSITLDDAFTLCKQGMFLPAREQGMVFADLFDQLAGRLRGVLRALYEHGRAFGTLPNVAPLRSVFYRGERAQRIARTNSLFSFCILRPRTRFVRKLGALEQVVADLQKEACGVVREMTQSPSQGIRKQWKCLEILHYDLNTCLCETTIVLKSFFCVLPSNELREFRKLLVPAIATRPERPDPLLTKMADASVQRPDHPMFAAVAGLRDDSRLRQQSGRNKDNQGSRDRISTTRMRPDGTGGPNETN